MIESTHGAFLRKQPPGWRKWGSTLLLLLVLVWAFAGTQFNPVELAKGFPKMIEMAQRSMPPDTSRIFSPQAYGLPPELSWQETLLPLPLPPELGEIRERWWYNTWPQTILGGTIQTIQMAIAGTFLAAIFAFPLSFLAARNTAPHPLCYYTIKSVVNFLRSIPDFAVGLVLISAIGLGAFTGTMALAFATTMVLVKLFSEAIESIDPGIVEAIQATGANHWQVYSFAVVPQVMPEFLSFVIYRFEANIRSATVLGLIGAGGIGLLMNSDFRMFQYPQAAMSVLVLVVLVMAVDYGSAKLRKLVI
ncbi:MAG: phosphonate ABC transporter, permease protein PhnE [Cyanobacteria bacterium NC_groundwater_1444_Ag_S-0.65um_54_12]|nr:phosphonate ABC transporter, permease protein PhnE [Cyanobacteria bacterium NC_groundwater_1444_Ag_S-0.65um_54_12]